MATSILVVSKFPEIRERITQVLSKDIFNIYWANDSAAAVNILKTTALEIVVTDIDIGQLDGWRLSRLIRSGIFPSESALPIILLTETHCERIAETTAKIFDINQVVPYDELDLLEKYIYQTLQKSLPSQALHKALVIEDTSDTAFLIQRILKSQFTVDIAPDGESGLKAYNKSTYDIVLVDIMMPGISGVEVIEKIREMNTQQVIIVMTAHGTIDLAELIMNKGATDYIQKPFKAEQLRKVCDISFKRDDFIISNKQFAQRTNALTQERQKFKILTNTHNRILNSLSSIIIELDEQFRIKFINQAWYEHTGESLTQATNSNYLESINKDERYIIEQQLELLKTGKIEQAKFEYILNTNDDKSLWCEASFTLLNDNTKANCISFTGTIENITERKKSEERLKHVAIHDALTNLHNRYYFDNELHKLTVATNNNKQQHSLLYIDLDNFKIINDTQGHHQGDKVLKEIAKLLSDEISVNDLLCRIGGDEFTIILYNTNLNHADKIANKILKTVACTRFQFNQQVYQVQCSIGVKGIDGKTENSEHYLQHADIAMFAAKKRGKNCVHVYTESDALTTQLTSNFEWAQKIQNAVDNDEIILHFQPIINVKDKEIAYYEALVRLSIDGNIIYPGDFIPALEQENNIKTLDYHVIGKALKMLKEYDFLPKVAINLSAQACSDEQLLKYIEQKIALYNICPTRLIFELTETASLSNITATLRLVNRLNEIGCSFSIDDFGTGFSTFTYLKQLPASSVKIDGSFVKNMDTDPVDASLVKAIHDAAKALNKKSVAEFVENAAILEKLEEIGVDYAQGYYISKPMPIEILINENQKLIATS